MLKNLHLIFILTTAFLPAFSFSNDKNTNEPYTFPAGGAEDLIHLKKLPDHLQKNESNENDEAIKIHTSCKNADGKIVKPDEPEFAPCMSESRKN